MTGDGVHMHLVTYASERLAPEGRTLIGQREHSQWRKTCDHMVWGKSYIRGVKFLFWVLILLLL